MQTFCSIFTSCIESINIRKSNCIIGCTFDTVLQLLKTILDTFIEDRGNVESEGLDTDERAARLNFNAYLLQEFKIRDGNIPPNLIENQLCKFIIL